MEAIRLIERSLVKSIATRLFRQTLDLEPKTPTIQVGPGQLGPQNLFAQTNTLKQQSPFQFILVARSYSLSGKLQLAHKHLRLRRQLVTTVGYLDRVPYLIEGSTGRLFTYVRPIRLTLPGFNSPNIWIRHRLLPSRKDGDHTFLH